MRPPWAWRSPWHLVSALVVGTVGGFAFVAWAIAQRHVVSETVDEVRPLPIWMSTRQLTELCEDGYGPGGFYERAIRDGLGMPQRSLDELRQQREALLMMGVPESALEPLLDPRLS